ncbi:MAG: glutamine--fructose-6-phosphate transaminase (isomerizing) [Halobacteriovoraceae bacterium]|nr:glutamine--fructose-6-phosphate transaminase (isomerizing) [Halobacteriovoraceae bacterium]
MCGIVGYIGNHDAVEPIIEGLQRLEYRGYDSAGISFKDNAGNLQILKKEGKLENLKNLIKEKKPTSSVGIGHTRWATHGKVSDINAHPHGNQSFAIVHNGIIENAFEIKEDLVKEGFKFSSETDTEVFLVLLTKIYNETKDIKKSIFETFKKVAGNSAVVILHKDENKLYAIKRSAPLVCGLKNGKEEKDFFVSSDPYALLGFVEEISFPEDEVLCVLNKDKNTLEFYEADGSKSTRFKSERKDTEHTIESKGEYEHFMLKEIFEQPVLLSKILDYYSSGEGKKLIERVKNKEFSHIHIIGCGTAWHAGLVLKNFMESRLSLKVSVELASEFRYREPLLKKDELAIFISQSGETADTIACAELCKENGLTLYSIVNVQGSTLYRMCDENFLIHAGQEIGVASTKAFTLQVVVGVILAEALKGNNPEQVLKTELLILTERINDILINNEKIQEVAQEVYNQDGFIFTGRNKYFPIALEGALKLKEIAYVHAEGYAAGELKHGPIALIDEKMVNIAIIGPELFEKTLSNAEEVKARRGIIVTVGPKGIEKLKHISDYYIELNFEGLSIFSSVYSNIVMQLLSYYIAREKGTDIDKPRNLAKSVTVE